MTCINWTEEDWKCKKCEKRKVWSNIYSDGGVSLYPVCQECDKDKLYHNQSTLTSFDIKEITDEKIKN